MARVAVNSRELAATLLVVGPRRAGKSTMLRALRDRLLVVDDAADSFASLTEPLLDWLPLDLGSIGGWRVRLDLFAVASGPHHDITRRLLMHDADGLLLIVDSQAARLDDNFETVQQLDRGLTGSDGNRRELPRVLCYSKQDLPGELILTPAVLDTTFNPNGLPSSGADLLRGKGVVEPLHALVTRVLRNHVTPSGKAGNNA